MNETLDTQAAPVFSYTLASSDLRYIEIGERQIFLRDEPGKGLVFRGEITGCGPECDTNLSEILLEYAMSCEGCSRAELATEMITHFGDHLGQVYVDNIGKDSQEHDSTEQISSALSCILNSMEAKFIEEIKSASLEYSLDCCPLSECAKDTGLNRSVEMAYLTLIALLNSILDRLAPEWTLVRPSSVEINIPMHQILIAKLDA
jgi:hypothetical protein